MENDEQTKELIDQISRMALTLGMCVALIETIHYILEFNGMSTDEVKLLKEKITNNIEVIFYG